VSRQCADVLEWLSERAIKDFGAEIDTYRSASYVQQFGIEVSDRQCEHGVAAIAERKSR
jgi:hypothetical protein